MILHQEFKLAIGRKLAVARKAKGVSARVAAREGLTRQTSHHSAIRRLETGIWGNDVDVSLKSLSSYYGVPVSTFLPVGVTLDDVRETCRPMFAVKPAIPSTPKPETQIALVSKQDAPVILPVSSETKNAPKLVAIGPEIEKPKNLTGAGREAAIRKASAELAVPVSRAILMQSELPRAKVATVWVKEPDWSAILGDAKLSRPVMSQRAAVPPRISTPAHSMVATTWIKKPELAAVA